MTTWVGWTFKISWIIKYVWYYEAWWLGSLIRFHFWLIVHGSGDFFFQLFNWFQLFSSENKISESCRSWYEQVKNGGLKVGVDGFCNFKWSSVISFSKQNHPWSMLFSHYWWLNYMFTPAPCQLFFHILISSCKTFRPSW